MKNLEKYLSVLDDQVDGLLLTSRYSRHYGAEFDIAEGMAVVSKKGCRYFTDSRYIESATNNIHDFEVVMTDRNRNYALLINQAIADFDIHTLGYEEEYMTAGECSRFQQSLNAGQVMHWLAAFLIPLNIGHCFGKRHCTHSLIRSHTCNHYCNAAIDCTILSIFSCAFASFAFSASTSFSGAFAKKP